MSHAPNKAPHELEPGEYAKWGASGDLSSVQNSEATLTETAPVSHEDVLKNIYAYYRISDQTIQITFSSCRLASEFERILAAGGGSDGYYS